MFRRICPTILAALLLPSALLVDLRPASACPICPAGQITLSEDLAANDATLIVKLVDRGPVPAAGPATFEVVEALKGGHHVARQPGAVKPYRFQVLYFGDAPLETSFVMFGNFRPNQEWGAPQIVSDAALAYLRQLPKLINSQTDRLTFCENYFEHADPLLAGDAYDEFARAPYSDLVAIRARMREKLLRWIADKNIATHHRRLYLCMLSVCGTPDDTVMLEKLIRNSDRSSRMALDALLGAYLVLKGPEGMTLVEDLFLKNARAEYTDTYAAIMALRFIGTETKAVPRERLTAGLRHMLARPTLADLVIPDLARWQDWSAMPRLVDLFKTADEQSAWVRVPVVNYLRACPLPEAKTHLEELTKIDPEAIKRANVYVPQAAVPPEGAQRQASE